MGYKLIAKIGEGGMGEVWRASDTTLGREIAIKILPAAFASDPERLARLVMVPVGEPRTSLTLVQNWSAQLK